MALSCCMEGPFHEGLEVKLELEEKKIQGDFTELGFGHLLRLHL